MTTMLRSDHDTALARLTASVQRWRDAQAELAASKVARDDALLRAHHNSGHTARDLSRETGTPLRHAYTLLKGDAPEGLSPEPATVADCVQAANRYRDANMSLDAARAERDQAVVVASEAGIYPPEIGAITGLTMARQYQILRESGSDHITYHPKFSPPGRYWRKHAEQQDQG